MDRERTDRREVGAVPIVVKKELRQRLRTILAGFSPEQVSTKSLRACHRLFQEPEYANAEIIMVFLSLPKEVDTTALVLRAWQDRKRVVTPKVSWNQRRIVPVEIRSLTEDLAESSMGIREPVSGVPIPSSLVDLVIVPGLAFDEFGNRLGRGRGFYDRFLAQPDFTGVSCALAFEEQLTTSVPVGPLDQRINMLVTDKSVRRFKSTDE